MLQKKLHKNVIGYVRLILVQINAKMIVIDAIKRNRFLTAGFQPSKSHIGAINQMICLFILLDKTDLLLSLQ